MRRNPFAANEQQIRRVAERVSQSPAANARPTEAVASLSTVGHNRIDGCDTSGDYYNCGLLGFTPLSDFILCDGL